MTTTIMISTSVKPLDELFFMGGTDYLWMDDKRSNASSGDIQPDKTGCFKVKIP